MKTLVTMVLVLLPVAILALAYVSYRYGYGKGYAAKERVIWDEDAERIKEYRSGQSTSRPVSR